VNPVALALFIVWLIEAPISVVVTIVNIVDAHEALKYAQAAPEATATELDIARSHRAREGFRLAVAVIFFVIGWLALGSILGFIPATGGVLISGGLVIAHALIIANSFGDLRLRRRVRARRINGGK
jgi:hypothetical protein